MRKLLSIFFLLAATVGYGQFNPAKHIAANKPLATTGKPTDARSFFYDGVTFTYRPFQSRAEILAYLNTASSRVGNFPIYMDSTGVIYELWFRNGTTDADLEIKASGGSGSASVKLSPDLIAGDGTDASPYTPKTFTVGTVAELKAYSGTFKFYARVEGQNAAGDGGGRFFRWDATSTATPDNVTIVAPDAGGTGRWIAVPNNGVYDGAWWGINKSSLGATVNTILAAVPAGSVVRMPKDVYTLGTTMIFNKPITFDFNGSTVTRSGPTGNYISIQSHFVTLMNLQGQGNYADTAYIQGGKVNNFIITEGNTNTTPWTNITLYNMDYKLGNNSGIWLHYVDGFKVEECQIDSVAYAGFMYSSAINGKTINSGGKNFRGVYVYKGTAPNIDTSINAYGLAFTRGGLPGDYNSSNNEVIGGTWEDNPEWEMIDTHGSDHLLITKTKIRKARKGIAMVYYGTPADASQDVRVIENFIDNSDLPLAESAIQYQGHSDTAYMSGTIADNTIIGSGIEISNTKGVKILANDIYNPSRGFGIYLKNNNYDFLIDGLVVYDVWDAAGGGNNAGIKPYLTKNFGTVRNAHVKRGRFTPPAGFETYLNRYGIRPNSDDLSNRILVDKATCNFKEAFFEYGNKSSLVFINNSGRRRVTASYTVVPEDYEIGYEHATGGLHTITNPAPDSLYHYRRIVITNSSPGSLGISPGFYTVFGGTLQTSIPGRSWVEITLDSAYNIAFGRMGQMDPPPAGGSADSGTYVTHSRIKAVIDSNNTANQVKLSPDYFADSLGWAIQIATLPNPAGQPNGLIPKIVNGRWQFGNDETASGGTGITNFNGQTNSTQSLGAIGTTGTAPNWVSSAGVHTLNLPLAGSGITWGGLSNAAQSIFGTKNFEGITGTTLSVSSTSQDNSNLGVFGGAGAVQTSANFKMGGTAQNVYARVVSRGSSTTGPAANTSYSAWALGLMTMLEPGSGHMDYATTMSIQAPNITAGASTLGISSALILGVNTGAVTTLGNWSLYAYGPGRFSALKAANLGAGVVMSDADGDITHTASLGYANGGTNATTQEQARNNIFPIATAAGQQATWNGTAWVASSTNGQFVIVEATTSNTTPFEVASVGVSSGTSGYIEVRLVAQNVVSTTESKYYVQEFTVPYTKTQDGTLTIHSHIASTGSSTASYTPAFTTAVNAGTVRLRVNSASTETTTWKVYYRVFDGDTSL